MTELLVVPGTSSTSPVSAPDIYIYMRERERERERERILTVNTQECYENKASGLCFGRQLEPIYNGR